MIRRCSICILLIFATAIAHAQSMSNSFRRQINRAAILAIDDYEDCISLSNENKVYDFPYLFESQESLVFCDLIGSPDYGKVIPVSQYVKDAELLSSVTFTTIKSIIREKPEFISGKWHITIRLEKTVGIIDKNGEQFATNELFDGDGFALTFDMVYNQDDNTCQIASITGKIPPTSRIPEGPLWLIENHSGKDQTLLADGRTVVFNDGERHIMSPARISLNDDDAIIECDTLTRGLNYKKLSFDIRHKRLRLRPIASSTVGGAYKISTPVHFTSVNSSAIEAGAELGATLIPGKATKLGVYSGVSYSRSKIEMDYSGISYSTIKQGGALGYFEIMQYQIDGASQTISLEDIAIPAFVSMENRFGDWGYLTTDIGVKYYAHMKGNSHFLLNGNVRKADSDPRNIKDISFTADNPVARDSDISIMARVGLDVVLVKKMLYGFLKVGYEYGLSPVYSSQEVTWYKPSLVNEGVYPVSFESDSQTLKVKQTFDNSISFSRQAIWASAGIMIKF